MFDLDPIPDTLLRGVLLTVIGLGWVICVVRIVGLRSFSKMTAFDFVVTLATGSLLATAAASTKWPAFGQALVAILALLGAQYALARLRKRSLRIERTLENEPLLLMKDGIFVEWAMDKSRVARSDVFAKLRQVNALELARVRAVVLERTGDISVLYGENHDAELLAGVRGAERER